MQLNNISPGAAARCHHPEGSGIGHPNYSLGPDKPPEEISV
jgi:hypothetical protein